MGNAFIGAEQSVPIFLFYEIFMQQGAIESILAYPFYYTRFVNLLKLYNNYYPYTLTLALAKP